MVLIESPKKCVICGLGIKDGVEIHADHIKPKDFGGKAEIENGQTLCAQHNFQKKTINRLKLVKRCLFAFMNWLRNTMINNYKISAPMF